MKNLLMVAISFMITQTGYGQNLPLLKISSDSTYIVTEDDDPSFLVGGNAWETAEDNQIDFKGLKK